jgi:hypothetical protein
MATGLDHMVDDLSIRSFIDIAILSEWRDDHGEGAVPFDVVAIHVSSFL